MPTAVGQPVPVYRMPRVRRARFMIIDRHTLEYGRYQRFVEFGDERGYDHRLDAALHRQRRRPAWRTWVKASPRSWQAG